MVDQQGREGRGRGSPLPREGTNGKIRVLRKEERPGGNTGMEKEEGKTEGRGDAKAFVSEEEEGSRFGRSGLSLPLISRLEKAEAVSPLIAALFSPPPRFLGG